MGKWKMQANAEKNVNFGFLTHKKEKTMLILTRRTGEKIIINENISFQIIEIKGNQVRMGIDAPDDVSIHREEIFLKVKAQQDFLNGMDADVNISLMDTCRSHSKSNGLTH